MFNIVFMNRRRDLEINCVYQTQFYVVSCSYAVRYYVNFIADTQDNEEKSEEPLPTLTAAEIFFQRQRKLDKMKRKIANLASSIIENPENEVNVTF